MRWIHRSARVFSAIFLFFAKEAFAVSKFKKDLVLADVDIALSWHPSKKEITSLFTTKGIESAYENLQNFNLKWHGEELKNFKERLCSKDSSVKKCSFIDQQKLQSLIKQTSFDVASPLDASVLKKVFLSNTEEIAQEKKKSSLKEIDDSEIFIQSLDQLFRFVNAKSKLTETFTALEAARLSKDSPSVFIPVDFQHRSVSASSAEPLFCPGGESRLSRWPDLKPSCMQLKVSDSVWNDLKMYFYDNVGSKPAEASRNLIGKVLNTRTLYGRIVGERMIFRPVSDCGLLRSRQAFLNKLCYDDNLFNKCRLALEQLSPSCADMSEFINDPAEMFYDQELCLYGDSFELVRIALAGFGIKALPRSIKSVRERVLRSNVMTSVSPVLRPFKALDGAIGCVGLVGSLGLCASKWLKEASSEGSGVLGLANSLNQSFGVDQNIGSGTSFSGKVANAMASIPLLKWPSYALFFNTHMYAWLMSQEPTLAELRSDPKMRALWMARCFFCLFFIYQNFGHLFEMFGKSKKKIKRSIELYKKAKSTLIGISCLLREADNLKKLFLQSDEPSKALSLLGDLTILAKHPNYRVNLLLDELRNTTEKTPYMLILSRIRSAWPARWLFVPALEAIGEIDVFVSIAELIRNSRKQKNQYNFVTLKPKANAYLSFPDLWFPYVGMEKAIANDFYFTGNSEQGCKDAVIFGKNSGGKSTALRSILFGVILAHSFGIAPCGPGAQMSVYNSVSSMIDSSDCPLHGRSKHVWQSRVLAKMFSALDKLPSNPDLNASQLIIVDEAFCGTTDINGASLAMAYMAKAKDYPNLNFLISSHCPSLAVLLVQNKLSNVLRLRVAADDLKEKNAFKIVPGVCDPTKDSEGIAVAARAGTEFNVIERALLYKQQLEESLA